MITKIFIFIVTIFLLISCSIPQDKNTKNFIKLLSREEYMKKIEPNRIFNPDSAMLISTLPDKLGNLVAKDEIKDFEIINNGSGYLKTYKSKEFKKDYWVDIFAYNIKHVRIPEDINHEIVKIVYENTKKDILKLYLNSKLISDNTIIFTTPTGKILKMREAIFEYLNSVDKTKMRSYIYFGTSLDSYYRVKINYNINFDDDNQIYIDKELFIKDFGYYYAEGMSLADFNDFKKFDKKNPVKIQRISNNF